MGRTRLAAVSLAATLCGLAAGTGSLAVLAAPAGAAQPPPSGPPFVTISPPRPDPEPTATPTIVGTVTPPAPNGQITVNITITSRAGHGDTTFFTTAHAPSSGQQQSQWTFSAMSPSLAWNGPYSVTAIATESDPNAQPHQGQQSDPVNFAEGVQPVPPTGVSVAKDANGSAATVSWQANPEPDIVGYQVQRASLNGNDWTTVSPGSGGTATNYRDTTIRPGTDYQYRVIAVRSGAQQGQTISSSPSGAASTVGPPPGALFGPGGSVANLPAAVQAITDPVAGLVHPGQGPGGPVTGSPTAGGYGNLPYGGRASLAEPGTARAQDPKGRSSGNLVRTSLFVAAALVLVAIAAHLIRMRRALDDNLEAVGVDSWDRHTAGMAETSEVSTVGTNRRGSDGTRTMGAQRSNDDRWAITRAMSAQRRR